MYTHRVSTVVNERGTVCFQETYPTSLRVFFYDGECAKYVSGTAFISAGKEYCAYQEGILIHLIIVLSSLMAVLDNTDQKAAVVTRLYA